MQKKSIEDYLRQMYTIYESQSNPSEGIRSVQIAKELCVTKANVCQILNKLQKNGYVKKSKYTNVFFTKKGLTKAKELIHNYRVIEVFLYKKLKFSKSELKKEVHILEHAMSPKLMQRLDKYLKHPKFCPHGKKIHQ